MTAVLDKESLINCHDSVYFCVPLGSSNGQTQTHTHPEWIKWNKMLRGIKCDGRVQHIRTGQKHSCVGLICIKSPTIFFYIAWDIRFQYFVVYVNTSVHTCSKWSEVITVSVVRNKHIIINGSPHPKRKMLSLFTHSQPLPRIDSIIRSQWLTAH